MGARTQRNTPHPVCEKIVDIFKTVKLDLVDGRYDSDHNQSY